MSEAINYCFVQVTSDDGDNDQLDDWGSNMDAGANITRISNVLRIATVNNASRRGIIFTVHIIHVQCKSTVCISSEAEGEEGEL